MRVKLILDSWNQEGQLDSIAGTSLGIKLIEGEIHPSSILKGNLQLDYRVEDEIREAWNKHKAYPVFKVIIE